MRTLLKKRHTYLPRTLMHLFVLCIEKHFENKCISLQCNILHLDFIMLYCGPTIFCQQTTVFTVRGDVPLLLINRNCFGSSKATRRLNMSKNASLQHIRIVLGLGEARKISFTLFLFVVTRVI